MSGPLAAPSRVSRLLVARRHVDIAELLSHARDASELLKALSHESRLVILCLLAESDKSVSELAEILDQRQPAVSQQLARLKADHLVQARRMGTHIHYSLAREEVRDIILALHGAFCRPARAPQIDDPGI